MGRLAEVSLPEYASDLWKPARHIVFHGGRGGAKSWSVARHLLIAGQERERRVLCAREHQKTIADSVKALLDDQIAELGLGDRYESTDTEIYGTRNNSRFAFIGLWRNPQGIKSKEAFTDAWLEEANRSSQQSLSILIPTLRTEGSRFIYTYNPEYEHDPVDRMFRGPKGPPPDSIVRAVSWRDNPWFPDVLRREMEYDYSVNPERAEHVWGGGYVQTVDGAYFAGQLRDARNQGRMTILSLDPNFSVFAHWDLGHSDATAIWISQRVGEQINYLDYCEGVGQPPGYYMNWLRNNGYDRCVCVLPHDGAAVHPDNPIAMSYEGQLRAAGFTVRVVRNQGRGAAMQRVDASRRNFPRCRFDEDRTRAGVKALGHYHERRDEERNAGLGPEHDWSSHGADAFGLSHIDYTAPRKSIALAMPQVGVY